MLSVELPDVDAKLGVSLQYRWKTLRTWRLGAAGVKVGIGV
jgi:hypothetical protein